MAKYFLIVLIVLLLGGGWLYYQSVKPTFIEERSQSYEQEVVAFAHVNVVPMNRETVLEDQTVIVERDIISVIGDAETVEIPPQATVIAGDGKYLMPGLVDMHTHLLLAFEFVSDVKSGDFKVVFISPENEVTTILQQDETGLQSVVLKEGISRVKIVGLDSSGELTLTVNAEEKIIIRL